MGRVLDLGADGLMIPRLETAADVRETVCLDALPAGGIRGVAAGTRGAGYATVPHPPIRAQRADPGRVPGGVARIAVGGRRRAGGDRRRRRAVRRARRTCSHEMGIPGEFANPQFTEALDRVAAAAQAHGKAAGMLVRDASEVPAYLARGYGFLGIGSDSGLVISGARSQLAEARRRRSG